MTEREKEGRVQARDQRGKERKERRREGKRKKPNRKLTSQQDPRELPGDLRLLPLKPVPRIDIQLPEMTALSGDDGSVPLDSRHHREFSGDGRGEHDFEDLDSS